MDINMNLWLLKQQPVFLVMKIEEKEELEMKIRLRLDLLELVQNIHIYVIIHNYFTLQRMWKMIGDILQYWCYIFDIYMTKYVLHSGDSFTYFNLCQHRYCRATLLSPFHIAIEIICLPMLGPVIFLCSN